MKSKNTTTATANKVNTATRKAFNEEHKSLGAVVRTICALDLATRKEIAKAIKVAEIRETANKATRKTYLDALCSAHPYSNAGALYELKRAGENVYKWVKVDRYTYANTLAPIMRGAKALPIVEGYVNKDGAPLDEMTAHERIEQAKAKATTTRAKRYADWLKENAPAPAAPKAPAKKNAPAK